MKSWRERPGQDGPAAVRSLLPATLIALALLAPTSAPTGAAAAPPPALAVTASSAAASPMADTTPVRRDVRVRAYVKLPKKLTGSRTATITLSARRDGAAGYAARVTFQRRKATLQRLSYDATGRASALGAPVVVVTKIKPKRKVYIEAELVEVSGATRFRVKAWRAGKKARVVDYVDARAGRPTRAGTTALAVSHSPGTRRPTVRLLSVAQPASTTPSVTTPPPPPPPPPAPLPANPNPGHLSWSGRVKEVVDGDTLWVTLDSTGKSVQVRNAGIQAMEAGQCHGGTATSAMTALAPVGSRVLLTARYASSTSTVDGVTRLLRFIYVLKDGAWIDLQHTLLQRGEVLWYPIPPEFANSARYREALERARAAKLGMFSPTRACGTASQAVPQIWINYDGDGDENANVNSEYIRLYNQGATGVDLSGWWLRDGTQNHKYIPKGTVLQPRRTLTLHVGKGTDSPSSGRLYWGWSAPRYQNTIDAPTGRRVVDPPGNAAYLFDPRGNVVTLTTYPCVTCGTHPLRGKVRLAVKPTGLDEKATVTNVSSGSVDLSFQVLQSRGSVYEIRPGTVLSPGEVLTVGMRTGTATRLVQYWGKQAEYNLPDAGGEMRLRSTRDVEVACVPWGSGSC